MNTLLNITKIFIISLFLSSCHFLDDGMMGSRSRFDTYNKEKHQNEIKDTIAKVIILDTCFYYVGVNYYPDYDWRQDTEPGQGAYSIDLYCNNMLKLRLNSLDTKYLSSDPDTHHIINANLYTESSNRDSTFFARNGAVVVKFEGREYLKGILEHNGDIYTLSANRNNEGFCLRKNGKSVFYRSEGYIYGSLGDPSYYPTGAIYLDDEDICFCYYINTNSYRRYFSVRNCMENELNSYMTVSDMKIINGKEVYSYHTEFTQDCHIWREEIPKITGYYYYDNQWYSGVSIGSNKAIHLSNKKADLLVGKSIYCAIYENDVGSMVVSTIRTNDISTNSEIPNTYLMSESCMNICEDIPIIALSSKDSVNTNYLFINDRVSEVDINGYISRVAIEIKEL